MRRNRCSSSCRCSSFYSNDDRRFALSHRYCWNGPADIQHNVLAMSGRAVEAAGDVHTLLLDKTGTITLGNRQAAEFLPIDGVTEGELADSAQLASLADETPEGRSIVVLAKQKYAMRGRELAGDARRRRSCRSPRRHACRASTWTAVRFRKGAADSIAHPVRQVTGRNHPPRRS